MGRTFTIADGLTTVDLLQSSVDHFGAATLLFRTSASYFDSAGYLAHLAVELLLKAWLLHVAQEFRDNHSLCGLYATLVASYGAKALSPKDSDTMTLLDKYAKLRYPNRNNPVDVGDEHISPIKDLLDSIFERLPPELLTSFNAINPLVKGGRVLMKKKIAKRVRKR